MAIMISPSSPANKWIIQLSILNDHIPVLCSIDSIVMFYDLPRVHATWLRSLSQLRGHRYHRHRSSRPYDRFLPWNIRRWWNRRFGTFWSAEGMDFGRGDNDATCGVLRHFMAPLNHDLKYRKCRMWWWWWWRRRRRRRRWWWWWCACVGGFVFTTMCKLPRIPPWETVFFPQNVSRRTLK